MSAEENAVKAGNRWKLSLDTWAVLAAFLAALLIRVGVLKHVPWLWRRCDNPRCRFLRRYIRTFVRLRWPFLTGRR